MTGQELLDFVYLLVNKVFEFGTTLFDFINSSFTIGDFTFKVFDIFGIAFITLMSLRFVKKFLPVA